MSEPATHRRAVAVIVVREGKALILRRGRSAPWMPGAWNLPGGMLEEGETPQVAALRECTEETGITPTGLKFHTQINAPDITLHFFVGETNQATPRFDYENDGFAWVSASELEQYPFVRFVAEEIARVLGK